MKTNYLLVLMTFLLLSSCTNRVTDFTVISTKNFPLGDENLVVEKSNMRIQGSDIGHMVLHIPVSMPNLKEAIDKAIQSHPDCVGLADGVVKQSGWWALLYGQTKYIVEGTPLIAKKIDRKVSNTVEYNVPVTGINLPLPAEQNNSGLIFSHEVKKDESLESIAKIYNVSIGDLIRWNGLTTSKINPGMTLKVIVK